MNTRFATDIHFHLAGVQNSKDIYLSKDIRGSLTFIALRALLLSKGRLTNKGALGWAMDVIKRSSRVKRVVALALDWAYDENGNKDYDQTLLGVSNTFVAKQAKLNSDDKHEILFGASVNPNRADACNELDKVYQDGAVLIKLIPSAQMIDLRQKKHKGFFKKMADLKLPLLCHVGTEHTIRSLHGDEERQAFNRMECLEVILRLDVGLKVIAAHCAAPISDKDDRESFEQFRRLMLNKDYEEFLYGDLAAFFPPLPLPNLRPEYLKRIKGDLPSERLIFGSDFPMVPFPLLGGHLKDVDMKKVVRVMREGNSLDRNIEAFKALGFQDCIYSNAEKVLRMTGRSPER